MSDGIEPRPTQPFPAEGSAPPPMTADPLAGDWSDGLRGPLRALGIPEPKRLFLEGLPQPLPPPRPAIPEAPPVAPVAEEVEAPDAWGASEDPLQSAPPPSEPPSVIITFSEPPLSAPPPPASPAPAFQPDVTPASAAPAFQPDVTPASPAPAFQPDVTPASPAPAFQPDVTPASPAPAFQPDVTPPSPAPSFQADVTPAAPAPAFHSAASTGTAMTQAAFEPPPPPPPPPEGVVELRAEDAADWSAPPAPADAPTPWSEPTGSAPLPLSAPPTPSVWDQVTASSAPAPVTSSWEMTPPAPSAPPAAAAEEDAWSAPPPAGEPVEEWKAEAPSSDWEEIKKPAPVMEEPPAADWGTLSSGPDWSAPPPADAAPADDAWGAPPPPPSTPDWGAPPPAAAASAWDAPAPPAAAEEGDWSAPPPPPPSAPSWSAAPVGASALEQMDSVPEEMAASPEAAKDLFGSVPAGASLAGDDEDASLADLGPPEELASPEEFLRPVEMSDDDADLLVPVPEDEPPPPRREPPPAQPLGVLKPSGAGSLEVQGEHRVAVHTRGGRTRRGSVKDVDLSKSQFQLIPQGGGAAEPVYHAEVKAIFFMLAAGEKPKAPDGGKVRVTFADGRTIEGHRDGADAKHGFFLVPLDAAKTNTRRIYIAREATTEIKEG